MRCPHCQSEQTVKNGTAKLQDQSLQQRYLCQACSKRFNQRTNTPIARLRTPSKIVSAAINVRTEGLGVRATGRSFGKSHATIIRSRTPSSSPSKSMVSVSTGGGRCDIGRRRGLYSKSARTPDPPVSLKIGRFTSLSGKPATGSIHKQGKKRTRYLSKGH